MNKYSVNNKTNDCLVGIEEQLLTIGMDEEESLSEIIRYMNEFPREIDFNIAQYGNLLVYYYDVREFYNSCDLRYVKRMTDYKIWELYKKQVGYVARKLVSEYRKTIAENNIRELNGVI